MEQIDNYIFNQIVKDGFSYGFVAAKDGLYVIEILASAKSWWQNLRSFTSFLKDDNLALTLDGLSYGKLNKKKGLFDGEAAWNGNNLKGNTKTCVMAVYLEAGSHTLKFLSSQNPFLQNLVIWFADDKILSYAPTQNNPPQDGNRRQWVTIVFPDSSIKHLLVTAKGTNYPGTNDDDDIKLIIDGQIQKNESERAHIDWFWCGRTLEGAEKTFDKEINLPQGLHYLEFWADKQPILEKIQITFSASILAKRIPTVDDPKWTGDYNDDTEQMILARVLWGEARSVSYEARVAVACSIRNRVMSHKYKWADNYPGVILQSSQYSSFWEKPGKDPNLQALRDPIAGNKTNDVINKWKETYGIAEQVINKSLVDPTNGANSYFDDSLNGHEPNWAKQEYFKIYIKPFHFYEL